MVKVLFVCLGNICRSPAAEGIFQTKLEAQGINNIYCDSAGTSAYHSGERADSRMRLHAAEKGYDLKSISRGFQAPDDFDEFDYILAMDQQNFTNLQQLARHESDQRKITMMLSYASNFNEESVPDPYYGGSKGFEQVIDMLEDACDGLIRHIQEKNSN
jgi:protein-tyrosine phosphatase